jgi:hypothetical protein
VAFCDNHRREPKLGISSVVADVHVSRFVSFVAVEEEPERATWDFDRWHGFVVTHARYNRKRKITNLRYFLCQKGPISPSGSGS